MSCTRVLIVEDDRAYARLLREVLLEVRDGSYEISAAETLEEAGAQLRAHAFDVILLDLGLPDADETEVLKHVASAAPHAPIVVLSSHDELDVALESMRLGAQEYLVKGQAEHVLLPRAMRYAIERKRLQDAAAAARLEAEQANAVKDDFLAMLGHELRNPLAPIVTGLALIEQRKCPEIERELVIVQRQVQQVVRLVDDLLDVARIVRGKVELRTEHIDLADVVAMAIETVTPLLSARSHAVELDVPEGALWVEADPARLAQVIANLLTNAAKYTPANGRIAVIGRADASTAELCVRDTGMGMPHELLQRVFGMFVQGPQTIDRAAGGLGIGLAIARNIMLLHGGTLTGASEGPGKGSEFALRLPLAARSVAAAGPAPAVRSAGEDSPGSARRVLIVDDNQDNAELLEYTLKRLGHTTCVVHDGALALQAALDFAPDVALLDIGLPNLDGYEVARSIRACMPDKTPCLLAVTGYGRSADTARALAAGFDGHFVKPVDLAALAARIAAAPKQP
jgi:signal transduction histidine kinase